MPRRNSGVNPLIPRKRLDSTKISGEIQQRIVYPLPPIRNESEYDTNRRPDRINRYYHTGVDSQDGAFFLASSPEIDGWRAPNRYERCIYTQTPLRGTITDELSTGETQIWTVKNATSHTRYAPSTGLNQVYNNGRIVLPRNLINRSTSEALTRVQDQKINLGEAMLELGSTISMIASASTRLANALIAFRRRDLKKLRSTLSLSDRNNSGASRYSSDNWLAYQYGWLPLVKDIESGIDIIYNHALKRKERGLLSVSRTVTGSKTPQVSVALAKRVSWSGAINYNVRTKLYYSIDDIYFHNLNRLGLANPLQVAWAAVPYSFVVDWLLPVSNVLDAATASIGLTFKSGTTSIRANGTLICRTRPAFPARMTSTSGFFTNQHRLRGVHRQVHNTWPQPKFYVKNPISKNHIISAIALLHNLRRT